MIEKKYKNILIRKEKKLEEIKQQKYTFINLNIIVLETQISLLKEFINDIERI